MSREIFVREARREDKDAVLSFCSKTWEWGDYIPYVWDKWLNDPKAKVFVGLINDKPVGITCIRQLKPKEFWLSGARTHPEHRRKGVITAITMKCLEYAKEKEAKTVRLVTESTNIPAQKALEKFGFKPAATFLEMKKEELSQQANFHAQWAEKENLNEIWKFLEKSECFNKCSRLYTKLFTWISLEKQDLKQFLENQKTIIFKEKKEIAGITLIDDEVKSEWQENAIQTCYIDGNPKAITNMIKFLENHCIKNAVTKIFAYIPDYKFIPTLLQQNGFEWDKTKLIIYEKQIS